MTTIGGMPPSAFVSETLAQMVATFGAPDQDKPIAVSRVAQDYPAESNTIRQNHVLRAARQTKATDTWAVGEPPAGYRMAIALSDITATRRHHTMVSIVHEYPRQDPWVEAAWRLPTIVDVRPTEAWLSLIESVGVPVHFNEAHSLFIVRAAGPSGRVTFDRSNPGGRYVLTAPVRGPSPAGQYEACCVHAIDVDRYDEINKS